MKRAERKAKSGRKKWNKLILLSEVVFIALILFFMLQKLHLTWNKVSSHTFRFNLLSLITSILMVMAGFALFSRAWVKILSKMNIRLGFPKAYSIWSKSQLFKYVPGFVWSLVSRAYICKKEGIRKRDTLISIVLEELFMVVAALMLSAYLFLKRFRIQQNAIGLITNSIGILLIIIGLVVIHPRLFRFFVGITLKVFKQKKVSKFSLDMSYRDMLGILIDFIVVWIVMGSGFYFLSNSIAPLSFKLLPYFISLFSLAWAIGFLVLFAPSGLGAREGAISILITGLVTSPIAIVIAFTARIWWMAGEALSVAVSSFLQRIYPKE